MGKKAVFLDRDGVINKDLNYVYRKEDVEFIEGIFELTHILHQHGFLFFIITNQAGIGRGYYSEKQYLVLQDWIEKKFHENGSPILKTYHCPNHPTHGVGKYKKKCNFRKPATGMIEKACSEYDIDLGKSILIGDRMTDIECGLSSGIGKLFLLDQKKGQKTYANYIRIKRLIDVLNNI